MYDCFAVRERAFDSPRLAHVARRNVDVIDTERTERGRDTLRGSGENADAMSGRGQGSDRVRPDITSSACYQYAHLRERDAQLRARPLFLLRTNQSAPGTG